MKKVLLFLKKELLELLPPTIFFFLVFQVMSFARGLLAEEYGITLASATSDFIAAILIGKSILIVDAFPILKWFHQKRLIYTVLWRILFYLLIVMVFQIIEGLIPLISEYGSVSSAVDQGIKKINWNHFWAIHIILLLFISIYTFATAIIGILGRKEFFKLFFSEKFKSDNSNF